MEAIPGISRPAKTILQYNSIMLPFFQPDIYGLFSKKREKNGCGARRFADRLSSFFFIAAIPAPYLTS